MQTRFFLRLFTAIPPLLYLLFAGAAACAGSPLTVGFYYPTNGESFLAPATVGVHASVLDTNEVLTVQYFSGSNSLAFLTNKTGVIVTNSSQGNPFEFAWSNVLAGSYSLTAVATDSAGNVVTSAPVNISVTNPPPPHPQVYIYSPTNNETYHAPATVALYARALESGGTIAYVTFAAGSNVLGMASNSMVYSNISTEPLFSLTWSNVVAGVYSITAIATDTKGLSATSTAVTIDVTNPPPPPPPIPFTVSFYYPSNGQSYLAPANVALHALVLDSNVVENVSYFAGSNLIATVTNKSSAFLTNSTQGNPFEFTWSNVLAGSYSLTVVAVDAAGATVTSAPVNITVTNRPPPPPIPFTVSFYYPSNGQSYLAPANVALHALVLDSNVVETVAYFAGSNLIATVTNKSSVFLTNSTQGNPFEFTWSNVLAGSYSLTAVAVDAAGATVTSAPVNITVTNPPPVPFTVSFYYPVNGQTYLAPAAVPLHARVTDSNVVETVAYFAGSNLIHIVTNTTGVLLTNSTGANPFEYTWSNVPAGSYNLTAVATDAAGNTATSAIVNIAVTNPPPPPPVPFAVSFFYPTNGQIIVLPDSVGLHARVTDSNLVETVQYFANGASIGTVSNTSGVMLTNTTASNPFFLAWSNEPAGYYALTAVATDNTGAKANSAPVNIWVVSNAVPVVTIFAPDPVAVAGTNNGSWYVPTNCFSNYCVGGNTATFLVKRSGATNASLTVNYMISGTATNGVDYDAIPTNVTILPGQTYALVTIVPIFVNQTNPPYDTVTLTLAPLPPYTNSPPAYVVGSPSAAGAVILEDTMIPISSPVVHAFADGSVHVSLPASNGLNMVLQSSPDLVNWTSVCTNTVLKGSSQYVNPTASATQALFYRIVVSTVEPSY